MRFLVTPGAEALQRARPPVRWFLAFAALLVGALVAQRLSAGLLTADGVVHHYLGDAEGTTPLGAVALWEEAHVNAFLYGFLLLALGSLHAVSTLSARARALLLWSTSGAALVDLAAPFAIVGAGGAGWLRVLSFGATATLLLASIGVAFARFGSVRRA